IAPTPVPIIAPHELVSWLLRAGKLLLHDGDARTFWQHHAAVGSAGVHKCKNFKDGFTVHPISLYGDEAEYTQTKQKILVIYISFPLYDDRKLSVWGTRFPVFSLRTERMDGMDCLAPVWEFLCWSLNCCYIGKTPSHGVDGEPWCSPSANPGDDLGFRCRLWEVRGDWKWHFQCFGFSSSWLADSLCHVCSASKTNPGCSFLDFTVSPAWLGTERSHQQFIAQQLPDSRPCNALLYTIGFDFKFIKWCSMHCVQLGIGLHANGGSIHELLQHGYLAGQNESERFNDAFLKFKAFCKANAIETSQSAFKPYMLITKGEEFCFLQTKAMGPNPEKPLRLIGFSLGFRV
ncbi:ppk25, partial [Symbiodinium sp. CCMP2456]